MTTPASPFRYPWRAILIAAASIPALLLMLGAPPWAEKALADDFVILGGWAALVILAPLGLHVGGARVQRVMQQIARWLWLPALLAILVIAGPGFLGRRWLGLDPNPYWVIVIAAWVGPTLFAIYWRNADAADFWGGQADRQPTLTRIVLIGAAALPALILLGLIARYAVNVPVSDDWRRVTLYYRDALPRGLIGEFWRAKDGINRNFVPALISVASYHITRGNQLPIIYLNALIAAANVALITRLYARLTKKPRWDGIAIPVSVMALSLAARGAWMQGVVFHVHVMLLCLIGAMSLIMLAPRSPWTVAGAAALAFVASTSAAEGNFAWIVLALCLWLAGYRERWVYIAWGALTATLYAITAAEALGGNAASTLQTNPAAILTFAEAYLGWPLLGHVSAVPTATALAGLAGAAAFAALTVRAIQGDAAMRREAAPWIALGLFVVLTALLTSLGRSAETAQIAGIGNRYVLRASMFWIATLLLMGVVAQDPTPTGRVTLALSGIVLALALTLIVGGSLEVLGSTYYRDTNRDLQAARDCLIAGDLDAACIAPLQADQRIIAGIDALASWDVSFMEP